MQKRYETTKESNEKKLKSGGIIRIEISMTTPSNCQSATGQIIQNSHLL